MRTLLLILFSTLSFSAFSGNDFKVKLKVELVNHESPKGTTVRVMERGKEQKLLALPDDGDIKVELTQGKLYEIWIEKQGFLPHVIHNVHDEGSGRFKVMLYKTTDKVSSGGEHYAGVFRAFDDVKKMTIPVEHLGDSVHVVKEEEMSKAEKVNLKAAEKVAKSQTKAQRKIDRFVRKRAKLEEEREEVSAEIAAGEMEKTEGEEEKLKIQEKIVDLQKKLDKLAY